MLRGIHKQVSTSEEDQVSEQNNSTTTNPPPHVLNADRSQDRTIVFKNLLSSIEQSKFPPFEKATNYIQGRRLPRHQIQVKKGQSKCPQGGVLLAVMFNMYLRTSYRKVHTHNKYLQVVSKAPIHYPTSTSES